MLKVENLTVRIGEKEILKDINLEIKKGEVHVLFGPNGSGKTTLLSALMGFDECRIVSGKIYFKDEDITTLSIDERARKGMGILFQRPPSIRGVRLGQIVEICSDGRKNPESLASVLNFNEFLDRELNVGFSGGELKRSELLQLLAQDPELVLLDEPESGVDIESIELIGEAIGELLERETGKFREGKAIHKVRYERKKSALIITHTGYILDHIDADIGHVMIEGRLCCLGNPREILKSIRSFGYQECVRCLQSNNLKR